MSKEGRYRTEITIPKPKTEVVSQAASIKSNPCLEILQLAVEKAAKDRGGSVGQTYSDNAGRKRTCMMSVLVPSFPLGVGISLRADGRLNFHYDAIGGKDAAQSICNDVTQNYLVIAWMRAQRELGFTVQVEDRQVASGRRVVVVTGVK
jgi:hypothetical protein